MSSSAVVSQHNAEHTGVKLSSYVTGYITSIILTLVAFAAVEAHVNHATFTRDALIPILVVLAFVQFIIQLLFFLHLSSEKKPRWRLLVFVFMVMVVSILVLGTLWIMSNLNYRMTPAQVTQYLNSSQDGL